MTDGRTRPSPTLLIAPYLPAEEGSVGPWQLVPCYGLESSQALPDDLREAVLRLVAAYAVEDDPGLLGVVLYPSDGSIGDPTDPALVETIRHALLAGAIANNPRMAVSEEDQSANAGYALLTSENALVYGHPGLDPRSYVIETGRLVRVRSMRAAEADEPLPKVEPPIELSRPMFGTFDVETADAAYRCLTVDGEQGRRLDRSLSWYGIAFSNSDAVTADVRVGAARSALEVLTGSGERSDKLVRAVGRLLDQPDVEKATYNVDQAPFLEGTSSAQSGRVVADSFLCPAEQPHSWR